MKEQPLSVLRSVLSNNGCLTVGNWGYSFECADCHKAYNCSGAQVIPLEVINVKHF